MIGGMKFACVSPCPTPVGFGFWFLNLFGLKMGMDFRDQGPVSRTSR